MTPDYLASEVSHPFAQSHPGDPNVPGFRQPSYISNATINPALLMGGGHELLSPHASSQDSMYISEDDQYQCPSPACSAEIWVDYSGYEASVVASSPTSPTVGSRDQMYIVPMQYCMCGCGGGPCVPQRVYERMRTDPLSTAELQELILFRVNGRCGYPLKDALEKRHTGLEGRDDKMFVDFKSSISIRVEWLPYEKWTKQIRTLTWRKNPDHISRAKLATEVAKRMKLFFEEMGAKSVNPSHQELRVQPGIIDLDHLELVALKRVAKSSYMPHFRLIPPPPAPSQLQSQSQSQPL